MGNSCACKAPRRSTATSGQLYIQSKTHKMVYQGDENGIQPIRMEDINSMLNKNIENELKEEVPISGQTYKNFTKIQVNQISLSTLSSLHEISRKSVTVSASLAEDQDLKKSRSNTSPTIIRTASSSIDVKQRIKDLYLYDAAGLSQSEILKGSAKHKKKMGTVLKDFTKKGQPIWAGPTRNALFDAFYLAYSLNEDLVLNPHDVWDQILLTLKNFYNSNHIKGGDLFPCAKQLPKQSRIIEHSPEVESYLNQNPNKEEPQNELISWEQIVKEIQQHNSQSLLESHGEILLGNSFQIKRHSQHVYNQLIFLDPNCCDTDSHNLPYQIFPGHPYFLKNIVFRSSLSDWMLLREKIYALTEVAPNFWIQNLIIILNNFIETLQGKLHRVFWDSGFLAQVPYASETVNATTSSDWKFGWMKQLFSIDFEFSQTFHHGTTYTFKDIPRAIMSREFVFRIQAHKVDIHMLADAHKSFLFTPKNLSSAFEPLLTMTLTSFEQ